MLTFSGLPIKLNENDNSLSFESGIVFEGCSIKKTIDLKNVLAQPEYASDEIAYRFYRGIRYQRDEKYFDLHSLRYDITVILPGLVGKEQKKTSGHFHKQLLDSNYPHAELYEVLYGTAMYILQPAKEVGIANGEMIVNDIMLVKVNAGEKIVVPVNCSHCTVNIGEKALVFSNLVLDYGDNEYNRLRDMRGMGVYLIEKNGNTEIFPNPAYDLSETNIWNATIITNDKLGTEKGIPVYSDFIQNPGKFHYLKKPDDYIDIINNSLITNKLDINK